MELIYRLDMKVSAPTKTTTRIVLEAVGVRVERTAGSVQRALEEALGDFAHQIRPALLREAREARKSEEPLGPRVELDKPIVPRPQEELLEPAPAGPLPEHGPLFQATDGGPGMAFPGDGRDGYTGPVGG